MKVARHRCRRRRRCGVKVHDHHGIPCAKLYDDNNSNGK